ncbi:hypothetical protein MHBO_002730 [Bonamia ostreae]|uniref:Uncharacterized protein n=1 Tax=Bonamia ostreae TaxID=126728 RepID=A0ABV2AP94_9EUKA
MNRNRNFYNPRNSLNATRPIPNLPQRTYYIHNTKSDLSSNNGQIFQINKSPVKSIRKIPFYEKGAKTNFSPNFNGRFSIRPNLRKIGRFNKYNFRTRNPISRRPLPNFENRINANPFNLNIRNNFILPPNLENNPIPTNFLRNNPKFGKNLPNQISHTIKKKAILPDFVPPPPKTKKIDKIEENTLILNFIENAKSKGSPALKFWVNKCQSIASGDNDLTIINKWIREKIMQYGEDYVNLENDHWEGLSLPYWLLYEAGNFLKAKF